MVGERIAHYEIVRELGAGGMGRVYLARDTKLDREVALKVLPESLAGDEERLARFEREAKTLASLSHPNIVTIYSVEEAAGVRFMTMELVRGSTLDDRIADGGLPLREFLELAEPLADAVAAAHDQGIQHRDLKPANVMVTDEGRVKVLDFGLAKLKRATEAAEDDETRMLTGGLSGDMTAEGKIVGTIAYMSPEQAQGAPIDHRSDIFSLGILLYEMVTGKRPFDGPNNISVLSSILKDEPRPVSELREEGAVPRPLSRIVHRALAKRPEERYQSARDLKQDLADLRSDMSSGELSSGLHSGLHAAPAPRRSGRLLRAGLVVAGAAAIAAALMWSFFLGSRDEPDTTGSVASVTSRADAPSVAVLPFENLTGDEELDWLRHGLPEMLVTDLSQSPGLRVLGNDRVHTIMESGGLRSDGEMAASDVQAIGREAGVGMVVLGAFVQAGEQVRIDARVQDAATSEVLASERVSGSADAIFELVDELSGRIRSQVAMQDMSEEVVADMAEAGMDDRTLSEMTTESVEAYRLYTEGQQLLHDSRPNEAIPLFERAASLDPDFGMAWAKLSVALGNAGRQGRAREAAERAFELSEGMPLEERLYVQGRYYSFDPATTGQAIASYSRAADLFPSNTAVRNNLGLLYMNIGEFESAIDVLEEAIELGTDFDGAHGNLAGAYAQAGRRDEAIRVLREHVEQEPAAVNSRAVLARYLAAEVRLGEAIEEARTAAEIGGDLDQRASLVGLHAAARDWEAIEAGLEWLSSSEDPVAPRRMAALSAAYAQLRGRLDEAAEIYDEFAAAAPQGSVDRALILTGALNLAMRTERPDRIDALADRLEDSDPPAGYGQIIPVARMLADAMRGDENAARGHALEIQRMLGELPLSQEFEARFEAQIDGALAWAIGDSETALDRLAAAFAATPESAEDQNRYDIAYKIGQTYWESDRHQQAVPWFERVVGAPLMVVELPIAVVRGHWFLGRAAEERGETSEALEHYRIFLDHWADGTADRERVEQALAFVNANG